jgi:hypothetical protein
VELTSNEGVTKRDRDVVYMLDLCTELWCYNLKETVLIKLKNDFFLVSRKVREKTWIFDAWLLPHQTNPHACFYLETTFSTWEAAEPEVSCELSELVLSFLCS